MTCADCATPITAPPQSGLPGVPVTPRCVRCEEKRQIAHYLAALPEEDGDPGWDRLSEFEQEFLPSVREQFEERGTLTEKQVKVLERLYERVGR